MILDIACVGNLIVNGFKSVPGIETQGSVQPSTQVQRGGVIAIN